MKNARINSREFILGLLIIFLSLFLGFVFPLVAPVLALVLIVGGIFAYRHNTDVTTRTIAVVAIAGGITILLMILLISLFLAPSHSSMSVFVELPIAYLLGSTKRQACNRLDVTYIDDRDRNYLHTYDMSFTAHCALTSEGCHAEVSDVPQEQTEPRRTARRHDYVYGCASGER